VLAFGGMNPILCGDPYQEFEGEEGGWNRLPEDINLL